MTKVNVTKSINIPAQTAWDMLSSFKGIENYSPIERSVTEGAGPGAKRTCYMPDGAAIYETLNRVEDTTMEMEYAISEGPFPVENYVSTVKIAQTGADSCEISWSCTFDSSKEVEKDMHELFAGFYSVIIDSLEQLVLAQN